MNRRVVRRLVSNAMVGLMVLAVVVALLPLFFILFDLVVKGAGSLSVDFFTEMPAPAGESGGGVAHAIVGTLIIVGVASLIGLPIGIAAGIYCAEYPGSRLTWVTRFVADVMNGTPSIVVGVFAWAWIVATQKHFSALAGSAALAMLMIPMVMRTTLPGIVTGSLLAVARIAGETAPLLFTALGSQYMSWNVNQPMAALPLTVFTYATGPYEEWHRYAWAAALVLILVVFVLSLGARLAIGRRFTLNG